jgi:hypothetical protein
MSDALHRNVSRANEAGAIVVLDVHPIGFPEGTKTAMVELARR